MNRRIFLSSLLFSKPATAKSLQVAVLETFDLNGKSFAMLVHHADAASRQDFATWLQNNPKSTTTLRTRTGFQTQAVVFRVRMCFGRALIIPQEPLQTRRGELLTLLT
jgi:hypothetical protein